jgi:hypothetical protein
VWKTLWVCGNIVLAGEPAVVLGQEEQTGEWRPIGDSVEKQVRCSHGVALISQRYLIAPTNHALVDGVAPKQYFHVIDCQTGNVTCTMLREGVNGGLAWTWACGQRLWVGRSRQCQVLELSLDGTTLTEVTRFALPKGTTVETFFDEGRKVGMLEQLPNGAEVTAQVYDVDTQAMLYSFSVNQLCDILGTRMMLVHEGVMNVLRETSWCVLYSVEKREALPQLGHQREKLKMYLLDFDEQHSRCEVLFYGWCRASGSLLTKERFFYCRNTLIEQNSTVARARRNGQVLWECENIREGGAFVIDQSDAVIQMETEDKKRAFSIWIPKRNVRYEVVRMTESSRQPSGMGVGLQLMFQDGVAVIGQGNLHLSLKILDFRPTTKE